MEAESQNSALDDRARIKVAKDLVEVMRTQPWLLALQMDVYMNMSIIVSLFTKPLKP